MTTTTRASKAPRRTAFSAVFGRSGSPIAFALLLFTALIWLRLRLVTDVPRQAYAAPKPQGQQQIDEAIEPVLGPAEPASSDDGGSEQHNPRDRQALPTWCRLAGCSALWA